MVFQSVSNLALLCKPCAGAVVFSVYMWLSCHDRMTGLAVYVSLFA